MLSKNPLKQSLAIVLLSLLSHSHAFGTEFVRPRPLLEYEDILLAQQLDSSVSKLNALLTPCVDSGSGSPEECYCRYPRETQALKDSYEKTLQARPKWKGKILFWKNVANLQSHNLVMPAIENQLKSSPPTCKSIHSAR